MARKNVHNKLFSAKNAAQRIKNIKLKEKAKSYYVKSGVFIKKRPMASFFIALGLLFLIIAANVTLTPKPKAATTEVPAKEVALYKIGSAPEITYSAKVNKKGVIQIVAQTPGIVSNINVSEGQKVWRGNVLVSLSNNYQGGNAASLQRQLAELQYKNVTDTYDAQKEVITKQKDIANKTDENSDALRDIADKSLSDTNNLINLNNQIIAGLQAALDQAVANNDQTTIAETQPLLFQAKSANAQLNQASRSAQFQSVADKPPAQLSDLGREVAIKQLELQEKALDLSREMSRLQLSLARVAESSMYPAAPFDGVIEKVHVSVGQSVSPGTILVTLSGTNKAATVSVDVPFDTAKQIAELQDSVIYLKNKTYNVQPQYVSREATDGLLNSVIYSLPEEAYDEVTNGAYVKIEIPIGHADTIATIPYLPIDVVFQTQDGAFVYVDSDNKATARRVELGDVVGKNVAITRGLENNDRVILDRNVIEGDKIKISN